MQVKMPEFHDTFEDFVNSSLFLPWRNLY